MSCTNCNQSNGLGDLTTIKDSVVTWVTNNKMIAAAGAIAVAGLVIYLARPKKSVLAAKPKALLNGHPGHKTRHRKRHPRLNGVPLS